MTGGEQAANWLSGASNKECMRLTDLISALKRGHPSAQGFLERIDPGVLDELRAFAAHRRRPARLFAADSLEELAGQAADAFWRMAVERQRGFEEDPEAALVGVILLSAMRSRLGQDPLIGSTTTVIVRGTGFRRSGHPYAMA